MIELIIRNPSYFGTTLWNAATRWITDFVNNEPSLLPVLQDAGLHDAILEVLSTQIPASAEILSELPNLLAALGLNERGLEAFEQYSTLESMVGVLVDEKYLPHMGQNTSVILGGAMDELLRHQPALRPLYTQEDLPVKF